MDLPAWVTEADAEEREQFEYHASLTDEERGAVLAAVCRTVARTLSLHTKARRALEYRDPWPESTLRALERLRGEARKLRERGP